jgi:hypothetical protein
MKPTLSLRPEEKKTLDLPGLPLMITLKGIQLRFASLLKTRVELYKLHTRTQNEILVQLEG